MFRVKDNLKPHVGDIDAAAVPCGFGRAIGNKVLFFLKYALCLNNFFYVREILINISINNIIV